MTYIDYDNGDTAFGVVDTAKAGYNSISSNTVTMAYSGWSCNWVTYLNVDASAVGDNTISAVTLTAEVSGSTDSKRVTVWGAGYNTSTWSSSLTYNTADLSITTVGDTYTTSTKSASTFETATLDITDAFTDNDNNDDNIVTILIYETAAAGGYITNPSVTVTYYEADSAADYAVVFVDESGNVLKDTVTYTGATGASIELEDEDTEDIWVDGVKYVYESDDASGQTIASDGSTVVTVTFRVAETYSYTVYGTAGDTTFEIGTDSVYEGETGSCPYSIYVSVDSVLYSASNDNSTYYYIAQVTPDADDYSYTISYSEAGVTGVVYCGEGENIEGMTASTSAVASYRTSGGTIGYSDEAVTITNLSAGKYYIVAGTFQCSDANTTELDFVFTAGEDTVFTAQHTSYSTWPIAYTSDEFELSVASDLVLQPSYDGGSANGLDYIYVVQTEAGIGEETGIENIAADTTGNETVTYYNLQGMKVENPTKGVYIMNGKKVAIK